MAPSDKNIKSKSYVHGGLFKADDRFEAWTSGDLNKMLKQLYKIGHPIDTHFLYSNIVRTVYKQRADPQKRILFKNVATEHVSVFSTLRPVLYAKSNEDDLEVSLPSAPTFENLATVYTEDGEYGKAIAVCNMAINFGLRENTKGGYQGRIERIRKKASKGGNEITHCDLAEIEAPNKNQLIADIDKGYRLCRENALKIAKDIQYDLVAVSSYPTECPKCKPFQGKTFSISGRDPDFAPLSDAMTGGLFHLGCRHLLSFAPEKRDRSLSHLQGKEGKAVRQRDEFIQHLQGKEGEAARQAEITRLAEKAGWKPEKERKGLRKWLGI